MMNRNNSIRHAMCLAFIFAVTLALYWNSLNGDFIWDDRGLVLDNTAYLNDWTNLYEGFYTPFFGETPYYRPLLTGSFIIDYKLWGKNPFGYHFTNVVMHIVNALLVYCVMCLLLRQAHLALLISLLFTAHPVQSEAVAWISGRNDLMLTCFALVSIILHLRWPHFQGWRRKCAYACYLFAYMGALLTKESGIVLPLLFMLLDYFYPDSRRSRTRDYAGIVLISVLYYFTKIIVIGNTGIGLHGGELANTLSRVIATYAYYFKMLLFPVFQSAVPDIPIDGSGSLSIIISFFSLVACLVAIVIISSNRFKEVSFTILWVMVSLIPVCGIVPLSVPALEHRLYLGTVCFSMMLPCTVYRLSCLPTQTKKLYQSRTIVSLMVSAVLILYSAKTVARNAIWQHELSFWVQTVQDSPGSSIARNNLGIVYARAGKHRTAILEFKKALALSEQETVFMDGLSTVQRGKLLNNLGQSYYQLLMKCLPGEVYATPAFDADETNYEPVAHDTRRFYIVSRTCYQRALRINPASEEVHKNLGDLFYVMKNYPAAEEEYRNALKLCPNRAEYHNNLGLAYYGMKNYEGAEAELRKAISLQPDFLEARNNLALVFMHLGMYPKALDELEMVLSSSPDNAGVYFNLALVYLRGFSDSERAAYYLKEGLKMSSHNSPNDMMQAGLKNLARDITIKN